MGGLQFAWAPGSPDPGVDDLDHHELASGQRHVEDLGLGDESAGLREPLRVLRVRSSQPGRFPASEELGSASHLWLQGSEELVGGVALSDRVQGALAERRQLRGRARRRAGPPGHDTESNGGCRLWTAAVATCKMVQNVL